MLAEDGLDLGRADAEALVLDELLLAVDDEDLALLVLLPDVAGEEPAVAEHRGGVRRLAPVALHDLGAAHRDLADLARRERARAGLEVDDLVLGADDRLADGLEHGGVDRVRVRHRRGFGEAVALDDRLLRPRHDLARRLRSDPRPDAG